MGFERSYQVKIPTNQLNNRKISTLATQSEIDPWFITGYSDAEGSFIVSMYRDLKSKTGWRVNANFTIHIHLKDIALLESIRNTLGVGKVRKNSSATAVYRVDNIQELQVIVDHFTSYPLVGFKVSDFLLFKQCYDLIKQKQHLTQEGIEKIVALKYNLNKGLSDDVREAYPNIIPVTRPHYSFNEIPNPFWISGFVSGDSTFSVSIEKCSDNQIGQRVRLIFGTNLHIRDRAILVGMANYFNILIEKNKYIYDKKDSSLLEIRNFSHITKIIIPFFNQYPILGVKCLDFADFIKIAEIMKNKEHLREPGFSKIVEITKQMNLGRNISTSRPTLKGVVSSKSREDDQL